MRKNYYEEQIAKAWRRLEIVKVGLAQVVLNQANKIATAEDGDFTAVEELATQLDTGLELIREIKFNLEYFEASIEEKSKECNEEEKE